MEWPHLEVIVRRAHNYWTCSIFGFKSRWVAEVRELLSSKVGEVRKGFDVEWPHLDLNQGPTGYEPAALTN